MGEEEGGQGDGISLTIVWYRQVYGDGGDRITAFPVAYCYTLGICAQQSL